MTATLSKSRSDRPVMSHHERLWRIKAALKASAPYTCPQCGSGALIPSFATDRRGTQVCADCGREFCSVD